MPWIVYGTIESGIVIMLEQKCAVIKDNQTDSRSGECKIMEVLQNKRYGLLDIYNMPDGKRAELLDGQLYMMEPPTTTHQRILNFVSTELNLYFRKYKGKCEVFPAPFAVFPDTDEENYFEPDISVVCDSKKVDESGCHGSPDWIVEIVSPSSRSMDYYLKLSEYKKAGVKEYWIIDPIKEYVLVYHMENSDAPEISDFGPIRSNLYDGLEIDLSSMRTKQ